MCETDVGCNDNFHFNESEFPDRIITDGKSPKYSNIRHCCRRRCIKIKPCDINEKGCKYDEDCASGLKCNAISKICEDVNLCQTDNAIAACGTNSICFESNTNEFSCDCQPGFGNFKYGTGCLGKTVPDSGTGTVTIEKSQILKTFDKWGPAYEVEFDLTINVIPNSTTYTNVLHFTIGGNWENYGDRVPAIILDKNGEAKLKGY